MKYCFLGACLFVFMAGAAQDRFYPPQVDGNNFIIDGQLNEAAWTKATAVPFDIEFSPANNEPAKRATTAYIAYSATHLFVGIYAKHDPKAIRAAVRPRDDRNIWNDDVVLMRLDPYADARFNIGLAVNALGSQFDVKQVNALSDEQRYDSSFNINFESSGRLVEDGYQIEMKIPFSEIPFPNGTDQKWRVNFYRRYVDNGNEIEVSSQIRDRNNSCIVCQTTDELYLKGIKIDKRIELLPYVSSNLSGERQRPSDGMDYGRLNAGVGLGLNLDLNKNTSWEITINPDFSQVEADVTQIDVNSSFSLQYPERRPFFNRGIDLLNFADGAFYSRSIVNPSLASKILSQGRKSRLFLLNALDKNSPYLVGGEDRSYLGEGGKSVVNILRYQYLFNPKARMGGVVMNRFYDGGGFGHLLGVDGLFLLNQNWRLSFEFFKNTNEEPVQDWITTDAEIRGKTIALDGDRLNGDALYVQLYRKTEFWQSYLYYRNISPQYRADVGFAVKNNRRWGTLFHQYLNILNKPGIQEFGFGTKIDVVYTFDDLYKNFSVDLFASIKTYGQTEIRYTLDYDARKTFLNIPFKHLGTHTLSINGAPSESFNFRTKFDLGKDLSVNEETPEVGRLKTAFMTLSFQLSDKFTVNPSLRYSTLERLNGGNDYFDGSIARMNLRYQFSPAFNVRLIAEKNSFTNQFFIQPLIQWNPNPSTIFYLGGNQNTVEEIDDFQFRLFQFNRTQYFFKFQYLIGL